VAFGDSPHVASNLIPLSTHSAIRGAGEPCMVRKERGSGRPLAPLLLHLR